MPADILPVAPSPAPPNIKMADHHWLEVMDSDGHSFGLVVAQWNPGAKRWSHSGNVATGMYLDTQLWRYVEPCPMPGFETEKKDDARKRADAVNFHIVMQCLQDLRLEHGLCQPRERLACTHCNAQDKLDEMLAQYKGPLIVLSSVGN